MRVIKLMILVMISVSASAAFAEEIATKEPQKFYSGSIETGYEERYLTLRTNRLIHNGPMQWTNLRLEFPNFFFNIWSSAELSDEANNCGQEIDITAGLKAQAYGLEAKISTTLLDLYPVETFWKDDNWAQTLELTKQIKLSEKQSLKAQAVIEWLSPAADFSDGCLALRPNIGYFVNQPFGDLPILAGLELKNNFMINWNDGFKRANNSYDGVFLRYTGGIIWKIAEDIQLQAPGITVLIPLTRTDDDRDEVNSSLNCRLIFNF
ncbi:hypothetical protein C4569_02890 [Candidatus Parcubacteria bacterium]|nr:MAG: hypothetical protein C4569_02890 [Candidatus Parcubacteria bacterium]